MIHVFREKEFFLVLIRPSSWRVSQFSIRVVIIIIMDHSYNNNNKWRLHAIFSDPRVWINRGSTMDQHGSTWISRLQPAAVQTHGSCVMRQTHGSCVMRQTHGSCVRRQASHASGVRRQASDSWLMRPASSVPRLTPHASGVPRLTPHASGVRRQASGDPRPFSDRRPLSVMTTTKRRHFSHATPFRFAPIELYGMG